MAASIDYQLTSMQTELDDFCKRREKEVQKLKPKIKKFSDAAEAVGPSWSGSWLGHHANLYYNELRPPPPPHRFNMDWGTMRGLSGPWLEIPFEGMVEILEKEAKIDLDSLFDEANQLRDEAKQIHNEFLVAISVIRGLEGYEAENKLIDEIEAMSWGLTADDFAKYQMPKSHMTRDSRAVSEGLRVPPHIMVGANLLAIHSRLGAIEEFCTKSRRVIRQIQAKQRLRVAGPLPAASPPADILTQICKGFHRAARQLQVRHKNRPTINMDDEYDVQDLLHGLLLLHFKDVRPEEYSPSYAGGNTRLDFLLKQEKIVVEVKRTRKGLTDKELGEELIIDIARYRAHPDCKLLLCFVYDPEGRVGNPRGLESDLAALAGPDMRVVVLIEPS
jgi:hypothetical protein